MASLDINRVIEIGRLTRDMELTFTPGGSPVGQFSIAVNRRVKKDQNWVDEVNYFDVVLFGNQAKSLQPFLTKGKMVGIDGYLKQDRWQDKQTGQNRNTIKIVVNELQLLGGKDGGNQNGGYQEDNGYGGDYGYQG